MSEGRTYILTRATSTTRRPVEEILRHLVADARAKRRRGAAKTAALATACVGVVVGGVRAHDRLALLVTAVALPARTLQTAATALTIRSQDIGWAR